MTIFILFFILFFKPDLKLSKLEEKYFTANSFYQDVSIKSLNSEQLNIRLHYQDFGIENDEVIVLLHGAFASSHTFEPWATELASTGYRVIAIDLPYHGLSGAFSDNFTSLRRSAAAVKSLLEILEVNEVIIGGNSMGGGVSWYFSASYHNQEDFQVKGLILIDSIYPMEFNGQNRVPDFVRRDFSASIFSKFTPRFLLKYILNNVYGSYNNPSDESIDRYYDLLRKEGNRKAILINEQEQFSVESGVAMLEQIRDYNIPVLVMWGREDSWIPFEVSNLFKETLHIENEYIIIYDDLGHVPMEEDPNRTLFDLQKFLDEII